MVETAHVVSRTGTRYSYPAPSITHAPRHVPVLSMSRAMCCALDICGAWGRCAGERAKVGATIGTLQNWLLWPKER